MARKAKLVMVSAERAVRAAVIEAAKKASIEELVTLLPATVFKVPVPLALVQVMDPGERRRPRRRKGRKRRNRKKN